MADMMQAAKTAARLEAALQTMKRLHGDKWDEKAAPYRAVLNGIMGTEGCSVLAAALPIAKDMSAAGKSPVMLLAVAAEMCAKERKPTARDAAKEGGK